MGERRRDLSPFVFALGEREQLTRLRIDAVALGERGAAGRVATGIHFGEPIVELRLGRVRAGERCSRYERECRPEREKPRTMSAHHVTPLGTIPGSGAMPLPS